MILAETGPAKNRYGDGIRCLTGENGTVWMVLGAGKKREEGFSFSEELEGERRTR